MTIVDWKICNKCGKDFDSMKEGAFKAVNGDEVLFCDGCLRGV